MKDLLLYQSHFNYYVDRKKWKYVKDGVAGDCLYYLLDGRTRKQKQENNVRVILILPSPTETILFDFDGDLRKSECK